MGIMLTKSKSVNTFSGNIRMIWCAVYSGCMVHHLARGITEKIFCCYFKVKIFHFKSWSDPVMTYPGLGVVWRHVEAEEDNLEIYTCHVNYNTRSGRETRVSGLVLQWVGCWYSLDLLSFWLLTMTRPAQGPTTRRLSLRLRENVSFDFNLPTLSSVSAGFVNRPLSQSWLYIIRITRRGFQAYKLNFFLPYFTY